MLYNCFTNVLCSPGYLDKNVEIINYTKLNICISFIKCWTNIEDVGSMVYKCFTNVLCSAGYLVKNVEIINYTKVDY